jgi:hypothetical protein
MNHNPNAVRNHAGIAHRVAVRAEILTLIKIWLTRMLYTNIAAAPAIIDLDSVPAYILPFFAIANVRVASATDGAALNKPAKLGGLKRLPIVANADTSKPPITNRIRPSDKVNPSRFYLLARYRRTEAATWR